MALELYQLSTDNYVISLDYWDINGRAFMVDCYSLYDRTWFSKETSLQPLWL